MSLLMSDPWIYLCAAGVLFGALVALFLLLPRRAPTEPLEASEHAADAGSEMDAPSLESLQASIDGLERRIALLERRLEVEEESV